MGISGSSRALVPINIVPPSCIGAGEFCIHTDPSGTHSDGNCYPVSIDFCTEGYLPSGYECFSSDSELYVSITSVDERMNNTIYTFTCLLTHCGKCNQTEFCSVVENNSSYQLIFSGMFTS